MAAFFAQGNKGPGEVVSPAIFVDPSWIGVTVDLEVTCPSNKSDTSFEMFVEQSVSETGPWDGYGGFPWTGGSVGKDGTWSPGKSWTVPPELADCWLRIRVIVEKKMRFAITIEPRA